MVDRLKSCPFCAGEAYFARMSSSWGGIKCRSCDASSGLFENRAIAEASWNKREPVDVVNKQGSKS